MEYTSQFWSVPFSKNCSYKTQIVKNIIEIFISFINHLNCIITIIVLICTIN